MTEEQSNVMDAQLKWAAQQSDKPVYAELGTLPIPSDRHKESRGELRFVLVAGRFSGFEAWIKGEAFWRGLNINIDVDRGWIQNRYRVKIDGPQSKIKEMEKFLQAWLDRGRR